MTKSKPTPAIPAQWTKYIKRHARNYAFGVFSPEDAEQVAFEAFLKAQKRHVPARGVFDRYAKAAIRNALLNARKGEQRHWDHRESADETPKSVAAVPAWAGEDEILDAVQEAKTVRAISLWADRLPAKLAPIWQSLYSLDLSQREFAAEAGVSQARVSQRNGQLLDLAREALADFAE